MRIPKTPCPIQGLVPFWNGIYPIVTKKPHPVLVWLCTIHAKAVDQALVIHYNVSQEDIVKEIELFCKFKVGDSVELGPFNRRSILGRKWDFGRGTMIYLLEGNRAGRDLSMVQTEVVGLMEAARRAVYRRHRRPPLTSVHLVHQVPWRLLGKSEAFV